MPLLPKTPEDRRARLLKFGWILCWLYLLNCIGIAIGIFTEKRYLDPHLFVKLMCGFYLILLGMALYGYAKRKLEFFEPLMYFQLTYLVVNIVLSIAVIGTNASPSLKHIDELIKLAGFVMGGAIFTFYVRFYIKMVSTGDLAPYAPMSPTKKKFFWVAYVALAGFAFFLWHLYQSQFGIQGAQKEYFEKHSEEVWQNFCTFGQTKLVDAKAFCELKPDCVFAVTQMKKPCEPQGNFENTIYWFTNSSAAGTAQCVAMKTNTVTKTEEPLKEGGGYQGADLKADGICDPAKIEGLIHHAGSSFSDQSPMIGLNFSSRATALYARDPEIMNMWNRIARPAKSSPAHYSDAEWTALPKQTDAYYPMLKGFIPVQ